MTIRATRAVSDGPAQRTQASSYYDSLVNRLESQVKQNVPRSQAAWGAEQNRLGSWGTGLGTLRAPGIGAGFSNGTARPAFEFDPDEEPAIDRSRR